MPRGRVPETPGNAAARMASVQRVVARRFGRVEIVLFAVSLLVYGVVRYVGLTAFPIFFFCDEAIQTNHAVDLLRRNLYGEDGVLLPPYFRNVGKRLTKAPKVYLRDTGLLHHLLNIGTHAELENHPILGASWETFVLEDVMRRERLQFPHTQYYFWRTQAGAEVDPTGLADEESEKNPLP